MKRLIILFFLVCCSCHAGTDRQTSRTASLSDSITVVNDRAVDNLEILCKVWGFVKYHHPAMADSTVDMDSALFALLPSVINADRRERNRMLSDWVDGFGPFETDIPGYDSILRKGNYKQLADMEWIGDRSRLGRKLSVSLQKMRYAKRNGNSYLRYAFSPGGHLVFDREKQHGTPNTLPDVGQRLLGLFRYWNIIEYFFPYKDLMDRGWNESLTEYIPRFVQAKEMRDYIFAICELTTRLNDSHAYTHYFSSYVFGRNKLPVETVMINGRLVVAAPESPLAGRPSQLLPGDIIERFDGVSIDSVIAVLEKYTAQSNKATLQRDVEWNAVHSRKKNVKIDYIRDSIHRESSFELWAPHEFRNYKEEKPDLYELLEDSIVYFNPAPYDPDRQKTKIGNLLQNAPGVIVDFRKSRGDMFRLFIDFFYPDYLDFVKIMAPDMTLPGSFYTYDYGLGQKNDACYRGKIVVLVDSHTQSSTEFHTMMLQALPGTIVVGSQTGGADGNISYITFPGGIVTQFSALGCLYPDGGRTQRIGVRIDEIVEPTIEGIKAGRDELLERAIEIINERTSK